jgi:hypothetical protein
MGGGAGDLLSEGRRGQETTPQQAGDRGVDEDHRRITKTRNVENAKGRPIAKRVAARSGKPLLSCVFVFSSFRGFVGSNYASGVQFGFPKWAWKSPMAWT